MDSSTNDSVFGGAPGIIIFLAFVVLMIVSYWKVFVKAGKPGWASIIPIYNTYITLKIVGRPGWWLLLYLVPLVNLVVHLVVCLDLAKAFGKGSAFGVFGLWLFSFVGYPMLAFGDTTYKQPMSKA